MQVSSLNHDLLLCLQIKHWLFMMFLAQLGSGMITSQPPVGGVIGGDLGGGSMFGGGATTGLGGMDLFSLTTPTTGAYVAPKTVRSHHLCVFDL